MNNGTARSVSWIPQNPEKNFWKKEMGWNVKDGEIPLHHPTKNPMKTTGPAYKERPFCSLLVLSIRRRNDPSGERLSSLTSSPRRCRNRKRFCSQRE